MARKRLEMTKPMGDEVFRGENGTMANGNEDVNMEYSCWR